MALKLAILTFFLWVFPAVNPEHSLPLNIIENCSMQEEKEFLGAFKEECIKTFDRATDFSNVSTVLTQLPNPSDIVILCSEPCLPSVMAFIQGCYSAHDGLVALYTQDICLMNRNGTMCYTATYNSLLTTPHWQTTVTAECYVNFTLFFNSTLTSTCSEACRDGLRQLKRELGCCANAIYNNSFVAKYLPFADYALWSSCGLQSELPDFCVSAGVNFVSIYTLFVISALGTMIASV